MRKNEPIDFSRPRRQSYSAIIFFIYRFFKIVVRQIWPVLLAFLFGREDFKLTLLYIIIGISTLVMLYSILSFFNYYFYVDNDELVVEKGVFQKSRTNIPFERIQTINFEQNILHQLFNVIKLEIDTAGSKGSEFSFSALDRHMAVALRTVIFEKKATLVPSSAQNGTDESVLASEPSGEVVMTLGVGELIRLGLLQNHLRSFLLIIIFFSWILDQLRDIGLDADEYLESIEKASILQAQWIVLQLAVVAIGITLVISVIRTVLRFYDFRLLRTSDGFRIETGLINRRQVAAKDHKIQIVSWADNPLKRLLGLYDVSLKQAASVQVRQQASIIIPGCHPANLKRIREHYFDIVEWKDLQQFGISPKFIDRRMLYLGMLPLIPALGAVHSFFGWIWALPLLLWLPLVYWLSRTAHRKWRISFNDHLILVEHGLFGHYHKSFRLYKIQNVTLEQPFYHRLRKLANLSLHTASGSVGIPMIPHDLALKLADFLLYKIESSRQNWM